MRVRIPCPRVECGDQELMYCPRIAWNCFRGMVWKNIFTGLLIEQRTKKF